MMTPTKLIRPNQPIIFPAVREETPLSVAKLMKCVVAKKSPLPQINMITRKSQKDLVFAAPLSPMLAGSPEVVGVPVVARSCFP